jgi:endonuclease-3
MTPPGKVLDFHILMIRHGRRVCTARNPRCTECVLLDRCPEGQRRLGVGPVK